MMKYLGLSLKQLEHIVTEEIRRGKSADVLIRDLKKRGWPEAAARRFVSNAQRMEALAQQEITRPVQIEAQTPHTSLWPLALLAVGLALLDFILR